MTVLILLLKLWVASSSVALVHCFFRGRDVESIAIPGVLVVALCFGLWGVA